MEIYMNGLRVYIHEGVAVVYVPGSEKKEYLVHVVPFIGGYHYLCHCPSYRYRYPCKHMSLVRENFEATNIKLAVLEENN